ncbi:MAG TPA: hypothetical protein VI756_03675 [Blastocatellia bacterium]
MIRHALIVILVALFVGTCVLIGTDHYRDPIYQNVHRDWHR